MAEMATVADLIEVLRTLPPTAVVVMSKDAEGNGYSPIAAPVGAGGVELGRYAADSTWSGEWYASDDDDDPTDDDVEAVVLWPTN